MKGRGPEKVWKSQESLDRISNKESNCINIITNQSTSFAELLVS